MNQLDILQRGPCSSKNIIEILKIFSSSNQDGTYLIHMIFQKLLELFYNFGLCQVLSRHFRIDNILEDGLNHMLFQKILLLYFHFVQFVSLWKILACGTFPTISKICWNLHHILRKNTKHIGLETIFLCDLLLPRLEGLGRWSVKCRIDKYRHSQNTTIAN